MKKLIAMVLTVALAFAGRADLMTYAPQGGDNLWGNAAAWQIDSVAAGRVPTDADDVQIVDSAIDATHPLTVAEGTSATVGTFAISNFDSTATSPLTLKLAENATLSAVAADMSYIGARSSKGPVALIQEAGSVLSVKDELLLGWNAGFDTTWILAPGAMANIAAATYIGRTDNAYCHVTNSGVFSTKGLYVGYFNGPVVDFENYGVITNKGTTRICHGRSSGSHLNRARLHVNPGASLVIGADDFQIGGDGQGVLDVEGDLILDATVQLQLGCQGVTYDYKSEDVKHPVGTLRIHGDGLVTTNLGRNVSMIVGRGKEASRHVILTDNAKMIVPGQSGKSFVFGNGEGSVGTLTLSNNAVFTITKNLGIQFATGTNSFAKIVVTDQAAVTSPTDNLFASGVGSEVELNLSGVSTFAFNGFGTMASGENSVVKATIADSAALQIRNGLSVGGGTGSKADIRLRGGTLAHYPHNTRRYLTFGSADSTVMLSGWGTLKDYGTALGNSNYAVVNVLGQIVADGEGESRALDFCRIGRTNGDEEIVVDSNASGTNGWYAINGGCLHFPSWSAIASTTHCVGDYWGLERPNMVNAFTVVLTGAATGKYLHGRLYDVAHEEVPSGLPAEKHNRPIGIWRIGYGADRGSGAPGKAVAFTSADVTMKIGLAYSGIKTGRKVRIRPWQYVDGAWVAGEETEFDPANPYVTFTNVEPCVKDGTAGWNLGWFAVTADDSSGLVLLVK